DLWRSTQLEAISDVMEGLDDTLRIQLFLADQLNTSTIYGLWLKRLRTEAELPLLWSEDELSVLAGTSVYKDIHTVRDALEEAYATVMPSVLFALEEAEVESNIANLDRETFDWLHAIIRSRKQVINTADSPVVTLVPIIGFINHSFTPNASIRPSEDESALEVVADAPFRKNQQIYINYGPLTEGTYFQDYGFVNGDNEYDGFGLSLSTGEGDALREEKEEVLEAIGLNRSTYTAIIGDQIPGMYAEDAVKTMWLDYITKGFPEYVAEEEEVDGAGDGEEDDEEMVDEDDLYGDEEYVEEEEELEGEDDEEEEVVDEEEYLDEEEMAEEEEEETVDEDDVIDMMDL
ncbi:hypothetical protein KIPB_000986, partial [Kipferlia bialata]